jgi:hypothetical protein
MSDHNANERSKAMVRTSSLMRAVRLAAFLSRNPLAEARAIVAACVAQEMARPA